MEQRPKKLLDHVRDAIRLKHYSRHTEDAYVTWIKRYIFFHDTRHPKDMGAADIETFVTHLAVQEKVAASTKTRPSVPCCSSTATCSDTHSTGPSTPSGAASPNACSRS
jgi:Phage integrase, N-terminal SAM-like domain